MKNSDSTSYKARKEAFVSDLYGSSLTDINLVTLVAASAILLWAAVQKRRVLWNHEDPVSYMVDFMLNVCAILFAITAYSSAPIFLNVLLAVPAFVLLLPLLPAESGNDGSSRQTVSSSKFKHISQSAENASLPNRPFITNYRGAMIVTTCLAILAVDFPIFPRRFAKVETWGVSFMDLGVGSFVFSAGVVSARAVLGASAVSGTRTSFGARLVLSIRHSIPLLVLGLIRLYSVKGLDYAEHVSEYGVHWNFFFTMGLLPPFVEIADSILHYVFRSYDVLAVIIAIVYELTLNSTDLQKFILISPRGPSLLAKNREGIFSFIGYLAVFLTGRSTGMTILPFSAHSRKKSASTQATRAVEATRQERISILLKLLARSLAYAGLSAVTISYSMGNLQISRRLANAPYVFWIASFNNAQLMLFAAVEHIGPQFAYPQFLRTTADTAIGSARETPKPKSKAESKSQSIRPSSSPVAVPEVAASKIMHAFNRNGLPVFLLANLLTGLINMTINTLDVSDLIAMVILIAYAAVVTSVAVALDLYGVRIKI